ncbi:hypothetical protein CRM94_22385 [Burkholderia gladioli]|uniref:Uncharacterized protein n=1 Tax=Burkholderia gladioli TaxID=28095 RepID=A0A2A7S180_BURGA|nr:hypothetical protein CRM94_22385 [Burkholderia gladioli]
MKCADHLAVRTFELCRVDQLAALLSQRQQLDLAIDALGHRAFGNQIDAGPARAACCDLA